MESYNFIVGGEAGVDPVALSALLLSLFAAGWAVWNEFTGYRRKQADEYWYRGVFSPNCVMPLIEFLNDHLEGLQSIDVGKIGPDRARQFCEDFAGRKESLLSKLWVSQLFSSDYYSIACGRLDDIEDEMAQKFGGWAVKPSSATGRDLEALRDSAIAGVAEVLAAAANIDIHKFVRQQKKALKAKRHLSAKLDRG